MGGCVAQCLAHWSAYHKVPGSIFQRSADFEFRIATIWSLNVGPLGNIIRIPLWQLSLPTSLYPFPYLSQDSWLPWHPLGVDQFPPLEWMRFCPWISTWGTTAVGYSPNLSEPFPSWDYNPAWGTEQQTRESIVQFYSLTGGNSDGNTNGQDYAPT